MHNIKLGSLPTIGVPLAGGYFAGLFRIDGNQYASVIADKKGDLEGPWNESTSAVDGATSYVDGLANTDAMAAAGSKLAIAARTARIGGFDDWHIGARDIVELAYRHFKPTTETNYTYRGDNPSSVPPGYPYTESYPSQTTVTAFQEGGAAALEAAWHWTSTQGANNPDYAWIQYFVDGDQHDGRKSIVGCVRVFRRLLVIE